MSKTPPKTLELALNALIEIERGIYPSDENLQSLQQTVWAWLEPEREKSLAATTLFMQATIIRKQQNKEHQLINLLAQSDKDNNVSVKESHITLSEKFGVSTRQIRRNLEVPSTDLIQEDMRINKLRKQKAIFDIAKKALNTDK